VSWKIAVIFGAKSLIDRSPLAQPKAIRKTREAEIDTQRGDGVTIFQPLHYLIEVWTLLTD